MAIEFIQIHNVVRTYQQAINRLPSVRQNAEQSGHMGEDQVWIYPDEDE